MKTRILFVDDEPNVLSGLRRMLRSQRKEWEMQFANGGAAALELLEQESFDVIVSDMRMPGIDGAELLTRVSKQYPNMVRLVLSGQSEHEKIFRAIGPAHQFLSKPCEPGNLIGTIQRACGLHSQLQDKALMNITSQLSSLPSLPQVYSDLVCELSSDEASLQRIGERIESDIAMTAKVLQLVNSSFFGLPQHVTCPQHAVALLGLDVIRPLVLSAGIFTQYTDPGIEGFSLEHLLEHSLAVATSARRVAETESDNQHLIDDAFIAGMLHDIGKLILAVNLPSRYSDSLELARKEEIPHWQAEQKEFGCTHAEVGAHLMGLWGLPNSIVEAIAFHHRPLDSSTTEFTALTAVYAANMQQHVNVSTDASEEPPASSPNVTDWDASYLSAIGMSDRMNVWGSVPCIGS
ncbi:HDOD domain-containing protein [Stieleria marina]|uniref:Hydrogenase transcriptional regulatory protein hupR1 n=1 Tax=Stieleria marina TaxID=1930275 RepID=A0A517NYI8_9BACT|nr:Hydrogenase transcriptional regulatory protein hupR1 [Planctomycetes bacterium K23_9]